MKRERSLAYWKAYAEGAFETAVQIQRAYGSLWKRYDALRKKHARRGPAAKHFTPEIAAYYLNAHEYATMGMDNEGNLELLGPAGRNVWVTTHGDVRIDAELTLGELYAISAWAKKPVPLSRHRPHNYKKPAD